jgi:WD40 repeat protein/energy-coupling factor transporter ATP-binding protein EcfA2
MQEEKICPYPGLRPFNEEESIFFRGREEHIEKIISQLQEKKFLMLTGASGDGKSSMVYAGIIPNARAGFFKAKFNSWLIADFRPERSPLQNMAVALAAKLGYRDIAFVEKELGFGFSSLISLYKKSPYYLDLNSETYKNAPEAEQKKLKRKAANLFILVDQFEEFFTNSENYNNGKSSVNAQLVVNLLLETAKIAFSEDLPIYIVCTMRSDYVGQCASFRGLPEYIGFSQFFVPRLKRKEVHQVIEEPAMLSGNKISNRLIETLINECDGQDQLPILQHALNRIWRVHVEDGADEMDIIHYAKVGGIDKKLLPEEQKASFETWYKKQPVFKQKFIEEGASLSNVLNAHARELYENAVDYCRNHIGHDISRAEAHEVLRKIFTCLTKINDSRAVRNRATVLEIKQIIGSVDNKLIEGLVNLFRESENTLLKPFILSNAGNESSSYSLLDTDILDITHESLIRNWTDLTEWTKADHENVSIIEDLKKQVERWEEKNRSSDYLLTIGSLSYFKSWYVGINLNPYLLAKYDSSNLSPKQKREEASVFIPKAKDYLRISEANIKRNRRAVIAIATAIALVLIGFTSWAFMERNKALEKTEQALNAQRLAKQAEDQARESEEEARSSSTEAQESERHALKAKQQAESSKLEALAAKSKAEKAFAEAKLNADIAKSETQRATLALTESEKAKQEAIKSKEAAEKAEKDAFRIGLLSLAQSIALKSELFKSDPQLQGLLAYQAYRFVVENGGNSQDPIIYSAIRSSYHNLNKEAAIPKMNTVVEQRSAKLLSDNVTLLTADKSGSVHKWDLSKEKMMESGMLKYPVPFEMLSFTDWPNILISGHKNGKVCIWDISKITAPVLLKELTGHRGPLRSLDHSRSNEMFATAGKDSSVFVWKYTAAGTELLKQIKTISSIRDLLILPDAGKILLALEDGNLACAEISSGKVNMIYRDRSAKPWCMKLNDEKNLVAVGFSDGKLRLFDPAKIVTAENLIYTFSQNSTPVEKISFNKTGDMLAIASSDKSIKIFNLKNKNQKALAINDIKSKTRYVLFDKDNRLIACGSDHAIRIVQPSTEIVAAPFCELLKRNLTQMEWSQNISETLQYQKTCKNKE